LSAALSASTGGAGVKGRNPRERGKQGNADTPTTTRPTTTDGNAAPEATKEDPKRKRVRTRKKPDAGGSGAVGGEEAANARIDA